jgi:hypothetical protein
MTKKNPQIKVPKTWLPQKNALSTLFAVNFSSWLSNFHVYLPLSSIELFHLNPTKSLPLMFFTTQKSIAANTNTKMNMIIVGRAYPIGKYLLIVWQVHENGRSLKSECCHTNRRMCGLGKIIVSFTDWIRLWILFGWCICFRLGRFCWRVLDLLCNCSVGLERNSKVQIVTEVGHLWFFFSLK